MTFGLVAIIAGVLGKEFTVADVNSLAEFKPPTRSSKWSGRVVFIGVGVALILIDIGIFVFVSSIRLTERITAVHVSICQPKSTRFLCARWRDGLRPRLGAR